MVWVWSITLSLHFGKPKVSIFVLKCYTTLIFAPKRPYGHRMDCSLSQTQCLYVLIQKYRIMLPKAFVDLVYTNPLLFTQNFFLTSFDFKISHLGPNNYPRLVWDPKWNFGLYSLHFGKPKVSIFVPKCYTTLIFTPKRPYGHRKDYIWTKTLCLNLLTKKYRIMVLMVSVDLVYTFDSRFIYKLWVGVFYQNSDFSFLGQVFQYCLLGLKVCLLRIASFGIRALRL